MTEFVIISTGLPILYWWVVFFLVPGHFPHLQGKSLTLTVPLTVPVVSPYVLLSKAWATL